MKVILFPFSGKLTLLVAASAALVGAGCAAGAEVGAAWLDAGAAAAFVGAAVGVGDAEVEQAAKSTIDAIAEIQRPNTILRFILLSPVIICGQIELLHRTGWFLFRN